MSEGSSERPWWASDAGAHDQPGAARAEAGAAGGADSGTDGRPEAGARPPGPHADGELCQVCPICAFLRVVADTRPEVTAHLVEAAHHLTLAAKAVVDAHAEGFPGEGGLERIELDDD